MSDTLDHTQAQQIFWIPIKKAKPEKEGYYLVWEAVEGYFDRAYYSKRANSWSNSFGECWSVTHWAKIPVPKESNE